MSKVNFKYEKWTNKQLIEELKKRKIKTGGRK